MLYDLVGFTGSGLALANWKLFGDNVPDGGQAIIDWLRTNAYRVLTLKEPQVRELEE